MYTDVDRAQVLHDEAKHLEAFLRTLSPEDWHCPGRCDHWQVADTAVGLPLQSPSLDQIFAAGGRQGQLQTRMLASVLELRASMPQQQEMLRTYLRDIAFPDRAKVLEAGCGTGAITVLESAKKREDWEKSTRYRIQLRSLST